MPACVSTIDQPERRSASVSHAFTLLMFKSLSSFPQEESAEEEMLHDYALSCLEECPPDVQILLKQMLSLMDLSDKDFTPVPARRLNAKEQRLKTLLTQLFPGDSH